MNLKSGDIITVDFPAVTGVKRRPAVILSSQNSFCRIKRSLLRKVKESGIKLSSPLVGYLGRVEENGKKCDRFYYLRDLPCDI